MFVCNGKEKAAVGAAFSIPLEDGARLSRP
jgi:hypothetical protein